jgi:cytolysin-activating lysine-acyltransferase
MNNHTLEQLNAAKKELTKLPLLGPALWLYARDPLRKYGFHADVDWRLMPPLVLEQCKLYHKQELPWAFFTWARVSDAVDQRLRAANATIAPHEWNSGSHLWLIDAVMPFQVDEALLKEIVQTIGKGQAVNAWLPDATGQLALKLLTTA